MPQRPAEKSSYIELEIETLAYGGRGIGRIAGLAVFVDHCAPGDRVRAQVTRRKSDYAEAKLVEVLEPSPNRAERVCPIFGQCGGCAWQHLPYEIQLQAKHKIVKESVERIGGFRGVEVRPIISSPRAFHYRNKMEFTFGRGPEGLLIAGFHEPGRWENIREARKCWLHPESFDAVLAETTAWARENELGYYDPRVHQGFLRHLVVRGSEATGGVVVMLLTGSELPDGGSKSGQHNPAAHHSHWPLGGISESSGTPCAESTISPDAPSASIRLVGNLAERLRAACPAMQGFLWGLNTVMSDIARPERILYSQGDTILVDRIGDLEFRISPTSFFQTNTLGAERLYSAAKEALDLHGEETLLDAYCGAGTVGLFCASEAKEVWGIELIREAVWDARDNAARNKIANARFLAGDMKTTLPTLLQGGCRFFDRIVVDPPRGGMEKKALARLLDIHAPVLVYISCNPTTLGRDLQDIAEGGYAVEYVVPVDMFPQTYHIEAVARCRRTIG